jgi:hypothetical protein
MVGVVGRVIHPIGDVVCPLFDVLPGTPSRSTEWPRTKLIRHNPIVDLVLTSFTVVDDWMPFIRLMLPHRVVMLVIAEFSAIGRVFVESMAGYGRNDFNAGGIGWYGEIKLAIVSGFVVVRSIKLSSTESVGPINGPCTTAPIAEKEGYSDMSSIRS